MIVWLLIWLFLILFQITTTSKQEENKIECLSYQHTLPLRGILAIEIVFGHCYGSLQHSEIAWVGSKIGVLIVGMFLFLSGWGLWESKTKKENYFHGFIPKHIVTLGLPLYLLYLIHFFLQQLGSPILSFPALIRGAMGSHIGGFTNWFVWELIVLYLVFFVLYKYCIQRHANLILLVGMILFIGVGAACDIGSRWYGSLLCFALGIMLAQNKEKVFAAIMKRYRVLLILSILCLLSSVGLFIWFENNMIMNTIAICFSALLFSTTVVLILMKIQVGNYVTRFLGTISYEIFIIHFTFIHFFKQVMIIDNDFYYITAVLMATILSSIAVKWLLVKIQGGMKRRKYEQNNTQQ